jgi:Alpha-galactosidases/6-phospho-beta-glucosidases, family 4 of glycosyl hydrolases
MQIIDRKRAENLKIAYIGGGSRGWAWQLMTDLAMEENMSGEVALYDIDFEAARRNAVIGNRLGEKPEAVGKWVYTAYEKQREALKDADFVVISILPGTFDEMASDVHTPEKYGVYQSVGDTAGPGGLVRALRSGPMFQLIAEDIKAACPNAWVINYTNPMAILMRVLYDTFPAIKAVGCCHEVFHTQGLLCTALEKLRGISGVKRSDLVTTVQGVNHFTWITEAFYQGMDLVPVYKEFSEKYRETGFDESGDGNWMNNSFSSIQKVKFDLFLHFGAIAAAGDRHLAEFNPAPRYLKDPETVKSWGFGLTTVEWRKQDLVRRLEKAQKVYDGEESLPLKASGEEGVLMMKALLGLGDMVTNVNIPNIGQIKNAPLGVVVETNAALRDHFLAPLMTGDMDETLLSLSMPAMSAQGEILQAIRHKDARLCLGAFLNDPLLCALQPKDAIELYKEMLENTKKYLPGWNLDVE